MEIYKNFNSMEELHQKAKNLKFNSLQLKKSVFKGTLTLSFSNNVFIQRGNWNTAVEQIGSSTNDMYTFGFCLSEPFTIINGIVPDKNSLFVMGPGTENTLINHEYFDVIIVQIHKKIIHNEIGKIESGVYHTDDFTSINRIKSLLFHLLRANQIPTILNYQIALMETLQDLFFHEIYKYKYPKYYVQYQNISSFMKKHYKENLSIKEIAFKCNVSERTMRNIFMQQVGISPKKYYKSVQLNSLRKELILNPNSKITETILNTGMSYHSLAAKEFREFFGVPPREYKKQLLH